MEAYGVMLASVAMAGAAKSTAKVSASKHIPNFFICFSPVYG
jgi:hypothetical protein